MEVNNRKVSSTCQHFIMMNIKAFIFIVSACVASGTSEPSPTIIPIDGGFHGSAITTRYWDCCKPSCSWTGNINTTTMVPVTSCAKDGEEIIDPNEMSGCVDGGAYMCNSQQAFVVNSTLAYGYVAASFTGGVDYSFCCACVLLSFQGQLLGKHMLAQITNTGSDLLVNQFDIAIPGGGVGLHNGCPQQWNSPPDGWGDRSTGIATEQQCDELPEPLQRGCHYRFDFLEGIDNPNVTFVQVECPKEIIANTGCEL